MVNDTNEQKGKPEEKKPEIKIQVKGGVAT